MKGAKKRRVKKRERERETYIIWVPGMAAAWVPICKKGVPARN